MPNFPMITQSETRCTCVAHRYMCDHTLTTTLPMTTWSLVARRGWPSKKVTSFRLSTERTPTGGRWDFLHFSSYRSLWLNIIGIQISRLNCILICILYQACHVVGGATGLIPSQFLEEKRKAFVPRDLDGSGTSLCTHIDDVLYKLWMVLLFCCNPVFLWWSGQTSVIGFAARPLSLLCWF